ncbi:hypothetical protein [Candidatus Pantoea multigeneris]|uniref:Uncharacterized protein n=1 Tax=Candidatus Pantoea multigeneris TaxID=2608357 RepID=A0ABX0RD22_9GAMM|nr:hypothetical protein [Pantoea multigeneris]NIF21359.1 hypothetical protein [Pantoea multigeneris]
MNERKNCLNDDEVVPYFKSDSAQIKFEFIYLITLFITGCFFAFLFQFKLEISYNNKISLFSILGGFFGGWAYNAKWFYRVTARGKSNQYSFPWESHKFYWRIFIPFLSALVAFCSYTILSPETLISSIKGHGKSKVAFSICFVLGYFSDLVLSRLASWAEKLLPKKTGDNKHG